MSIETGTILDADYEQRPPRFWQWNRTPATALQLATASLEECRRMQLEHTQKREYHAAMEQMLKARDQRLVKDIQRLSRKPNNQPEGPAP
jgi:hypothetical protein